MKTVITYGTFDLMHYGHYNLLKRAKELGDVLRVGVSSDEFCLQKGKQTAYPQEKRMEMVADLRFVDLVILENDLSQKIEDVKKYKADIFCLGDDYKDIFPKMPEYKVLKDMGCEIVFLPRTPDISTTRLKKNLIDEDKINKFFKK